MDNENTALYKETLFDKIFKPQVITLENGHTVARPRSRTPLIALLVTMGAWLADDLSQSFSALQQGVTDALIVK